MQTPYLQPNVFIQISVGNCLSYIVMVTLIVSEQMIVMQLGAH